jgi:ribonuclease E
MAKITEQPTTLPDAAQGLAAEALRAEAWAGEPFLRPDEDVEHVLAPGTSRRAALDDAIAEIEAGLRSPSPQWKVQWGLMLGLERVLADPEPHLASGTTLRRHQIDALAGMLTELIAAHEQAKENGNGNGPAVVEEVEPLEDEEEDDLLNEASARASAATDEELPEELPPEQDPGAVRRFRFRHPTASGKTIAAAGFVEAARAQGVLILTHRRLLVDQFRRDLTAEGYGDRLTPEILKGQTPPKGNPLTIQTYAWFARHVGEISRDAYQLVIADEAHTALGEKTSSAIRSFPEPIYIGMTATE